MTPEQAREILEDELGQIALPGTSQRIENLWDAYSSKSNDEVRMGYVRLGVYRYLQNRYHNLVTVAQGNNKWNYEQLFKHVTELYRQTELTLKAIDPTYGVVASRSKKLTPSMPDRISEVMKERGYIATDDTRP